MNQVRFQIGVPRVGSAARNAEDENSLDTTSGRLVLPEAGSAARAAEAEKAAGGYLGPTVAGFSLRGQNGTVTRNTSVTQGALNSAGGPVSPVEAVARPEPPAAQHNMSELLPSERRGSNPEQSRAGPLHLAASRFQTLVQSLFSSGDTTGKS